MKVLLTGTVGFIGRAPVDSLIDNKIGVITAVRSHSNALPHSIAQYEFNNLYNTDWVSALSGVDVVIHAAARSHITIDSADNPLTELRKVNLEGIPKLARQAAQVGVKRRVFISSIKVNGESSQLEKSSTPDDHPAPQDYYDKY